MTFNSIYAMNGKSIEVDSTDAEGRLVLSGMIPLSGIMWLNWKNHCFLLPDAIYYTVKEYKPHTLIDVATLE